MASDPTPRAPSACTAPPVLEVVRRRALELLSQGEIRHPEFLRLAEADAVLSVLLLRFAHSTLHVRPAAGGNDMAQVLPSIGVDALSHAVRALPALPEHRHRAAVEVPCRGWVHALAVATAARRLAEAGAYPDPQQAFVAGLVHDFGRRMEACERGVASAATERLVQRIGLSRGVVHACRFHARVRDGLPAESIAIAGRPLDDDARSLVALIARADALATMLGYDDGSAVADEEDEDLLATTAASAAAADALLVAETIALELSEAAALLGLGDVAPDDLARQLTNEELRTGEALPPPEPPLDATARSERLARAHRRIVVSRSLESVGPIVEEGLHAIRECLDLDRVILLEPHPTDPLRLRGRTCSDRSGLVRPEAVAAVTVEVDQEGALEAVLLRGGAEVGRTEQHDDRVLEQLGVREFAASPLNAGATQMGVVVADRFFGDGDVHDADARELGLLCDTLGLVLDTVALDLQGRKLRSLAEKDELTGISNRRNIVRILRHEVERARRFGKPLSVALLDVDHFKRWNDVHGHQVGDTVLQAVAQLIASGSREVDHYGRYGGEEFLIVLPETPLQHAVLYAERLRVSLSGHCEEMFEEYSETPLTVSIGVTALADGSDEYDEIVRRADTALYAAKKHGRNRVCVELAVQPARMRAI